MTKLPDQQSNHASARIVNRDDRLHSGHLGELVSRPDGQRRLVDVGPKRERGRRRMLQMRNNVTPQLYKDFGMSE
jgi:hypothetical protein